MAGIYKKKQSGLLGVLRPLDLFPRLDLDQVKSTWHGLVFSFFGFALTIFVLYGEFQDYTKLTRKSDFYLFSPERGASAGPGVHSNLPALDHDLTVNFNITFLRLPCEFLSVDYYDVFGNKKYGTGCRSPRPVSSEHHRQRVATIPLGCCDAPSLLHLSVPGWHEDACRPQSRLALPHTPPGTTWPSTSR